MNEGTTLLHAAAVSMLAVRTRCDTSNVPANANTIDNIGGLEISHAAAFHDYSSPISFEDAKAAAVSECLIAYPKDDGWYGHLVSLDQVNPGDLRHLAESIS